MDLHFPYQFDGRGRTRESDYDDYIRGLIEQVLFTSPGERVMRPDFGSGLNQLVFAGNSPEMAATTQVMVQGALQRWLGHLILPEAVQVKATDSTLEVTVQYVIRQSQKRETTVFSHGGTA